MTDHFHDQLFGGEDMYQENILEHYREPCNVGTLPDATFSHREINQSCGDTIDMYVKLDASGVVSDVRFEGQGCAISQASVSMLTEHIKGMQVEKLAVLWQEDIFGLLGFPVGMTRIRCALLGLKTLQRGLAEHKGTK